MRHTCLFKLIITIHEFERESLEVNPRPVGYLQGQLPNLTGTTQKLPVLQAVVSVRLETETLDYKSDPQTTHHLMKG